ncbi:Tim44/TimA family putative adaptor protein [Pseudochrobactrum sp. sp1633]|uniref:Tim44/TimA family putative adaptor protein n=1 Tax=Pseudochrobactrum sp. sp1633 TaxID=3036706 RepID=UPI0025A63185|nr:Tim44/TimA family putative adaptor protein [Pseudochrobactrum sp. sp1633]MDM8344986.1 Tim44/TimA family putative adaptor protein [Pseudochrobactrum sp. sp1633]HWD14818.1 Tim44/TimA family putative adaptor protein [Pseudochrobactrum sp.]
MNFFSFGTFFFFIVAVIIFLQLRSVLGKRTGNERPPFDPYTQRQEDTTAIPQQNDNVVSLPQRQTAENPAKDFTSIDALAPAGSELNNGLRNIRAHDASFDPKEFLNGAKMAYEMIVLSYADGDRKTLKNLLSKDVYEGFDAAIKEREARGEKVNSTFVGINQAKITAADMKGKDAQVTVRIVSEMISATQDNQGNIIDGDLETVAEIRDVWTFARSTAGRDPNWKLIATEAED